MAAALLTLTGLGTDPAAAQRIPYPLLAADAAVLPGTLHRSSPRLAYPRFPADPRIAPGDFAFDADEEAPLTPAEQQRVAGRIALAQLSQNYRPRPALWRIRTGRGARETTLYLFGTIHVLPPGFAWRSAAVERAIAESDTLIVESLDDPGARPAAAPAARVPLARRVSASHRAAYARFAATLPPRAAEQLDAMPTWMAAVAVGYVRDMAAGETPGPGADDWLEGYFRALGRSVVPVEDGAQVMARVAAVPEPAQRRMLEAALDARQASRAELRAPLHAWAKGEIGPGSALVVDAGRDTGADALNGPLLLERNRAWVDALTQRLRVPGTAFFAAGAGHFIGHGSVLELLRARGIVVERVE